MAHELPLRIEEMARELGMSVSSFHHHFEAVTAMSPLQFQKQPRLQEARRRMLSEQCDAATAGYRVGYDDASHVNREYKRLLGEPPMRDAERLREEVAGSSDLQATDQSESREEAMPEGWEWDETLYQGSAPYYVRGRPPYAPGLADVLEEALSLDGTGRLLDAGCGPGIVTLLLADRFAEAVGVDPDAGMLAEAERRAAMAGITNARWIRARAEELPFDLGRFRVVTFAQSFHWMDRNRVAAIVYAMLEPDGALVHVSDVKEPRRDLVELPHPTPPYAEIKQLVQRYLGPVQRAGQGVLQYGSPGDEASVLIPAGFHGPERVLAPATEPFIRGIDDVVAWVYSLSSSAPHLFGERLSEFESDLRSLLRDASPEGSFADQPIDTEAFIWRKSR